MAKITLDPITSGFQSTSQVNNNNTDIASNLNDAVLYRNNPLGESNEMFNLLDMNSNRIINLPLPVDATDPVRLKDVAGIIEIGGNPIVIPQTENIILNAGQTIVVFTIHTTNLASFTINGDEADRGRLLSGIDYDLLSETAIELRGSYPEGTVLTLLRNEIVGSIPSGGIITAEQVLYNNSISGLIAVDVQAAIDELQALISVTTFTAENKTLIDGQLSVTFLIIDTGLSTFSLIGDDVDSRQMVEGIDFTISNPTTIILTSSYPAGTIVRAVQ